MLEQVDIAPLAAPAKLPLYRTLGGRQRVELVIGFWSTILVDAGINISLRAR